MGTLKVDSIRPASQFSHKPELLEQFVREMDEHMAFAQEALGVVAYDPDDRELFAIFESKMFDIRGSAQQLGFEDIEYVAGLGEDISRQVAELNPSLPEYPGLIRRAVGALWDCVTTTRYLLKNVGKDTTEEVRILVRRMEKTLSIFSKRKPKVTNEELQCYFD